MSERFIPLAQSRASYYCKGSPVHFSMIELFRMESTGETVVTLTFKNLFSRPLVTFTAYYRCKNRHGEVIAEDSFTYQDVYAQEGESFGCDDAVFVSAEAIGSVEVHLGSVTYDDGVAHDLRRCPSVALPPLRRLSESERDAVCRALNTDDAEYEPVQAADGWRCTCGAFNYNAGRGRNVCSECGCEKLLVSAAVRDAKKRSAQRRPQYDADMQFLPVQDQAPQQGTNGHGRMQYAQRTAEKEKSRNILLPAAQAGTVVNIMKDSTADFILRYAPLITMAAAAGVTMTAAVILQMFAR